MELFDKEFVYLEWDDVLKGKKVFIGDTLPQLRVLVDGHCDSLQEVSKNISDDSFYPFISPCGTRYAMVYYDTNYSCKVAYYTQGKTIQIRHTPESEWVDLKGEEPKWHSCYEYRVKPESEMWTTCINDEGVVSVMPAREWNKSKGRQLIESTRDKCEVFVVENYCNKCAYHAACVGHKCIMNLDMWYCQGFRELKPVKKRRMTNRELAQWVASGYGECMWDNISMSCWKYVCDEADVPAVDGVKIRGWDETEWHEPEVEE